MASYGVIYGPSVQTRIPGSGVTRLPISGITSSFGIAPGLTPDTFVISAPDNYQIDFELNANGLYNDAPFDIELFNETLGAVVQSRRSVGPQQGRAEDLWFGFEFSVVNPAHEYSFRIRPIRALGDNFLVMQDLNFRAVIQAFISAGGGAISGAGTPGAICRFTASQVISDSIMSETGSVVSVTGSVNLAGNNTDTFLSMRDGQNVPVSAANEGRMRYNAAIQTFEVSENGGAWHDLTGVGPGTINRVAKFTAANNMGDSGITDDGAGAFTLRNATRQILAFGTTAAAFNDGANPGLDVRFRAGDAAGTNQDGGNILFVSGAPTGTGTAGVVGIQNGILTLGTGSSVGGVIRFYNTTNNNTVAIQSGVTSTSYTVTLPVAQGAVNSVLLNDGSGALSWSTNIQVNAIATKTGAYAIANTDDVILCDASGGSFTVTLPTAVGIAAKRFTVKRIDGSINGLTLATTSSQTIDGATTLVIPSQWTSVTVVSDGANWFIV